MASSAVSIPGNKENTRVKQLSFSPGLLDPAVAFSQKHLPAQRPRGNFAKHPAGNHEQEQLSSVSSKGDSCFPLVPPLWCTLVYPNTLTFLPENSEKENVPCTSVHNDLVFFHNCSHHERPFLLSDLSECFSQSPSHSHQGK